MSGTEVMLSANVLQDLELGEVEEIEELSGVSFAAISQGGPATFKVVRALIYVLKHRDDPDYTFEDTRRVKLTEVNEILNPTPAAPLRELRPAKTRAKAS